MDRRMALKSLLALSTIAGIVQADSDIIPYSDGSCKKAVTDFTSNGSKRDPKTEFTLAEFPDAKSWESPIFEGAEAKDGSGYDVWWQVSPKPNCGQALMLDYSQPQYGSMNFTAPMGNVVLYAHAPGCIYSRIPANTYVMASKCCGDECDNLTAGNKGLAKRDTASGPSHFLIKINIQRRNLSPGPDRQHLFIARDLSAAGNAVGAKSIANSEFRVRDKKFDTKDCKYKLYKPDSNPEAGKQTAVSSSQYCTKDPCSFQISNGVTVSSSLTTSETTTITNTVGASVDVKVGVELIAEADVTVGASYQWAQAIAKETSTTITNSTTVTVTNNLGQQLGTRGFLSFTPTYDCWSVTVDCGGGDSTDLSYCNPSMMPDGKSVAGDYSVVYVNS